MAKLSETYVFEIIEIFGCVSFLHFYPGFLAFHVGSIFEHICAKFLAGDGLMAFFATDSAGLCRLVWAVSSTMTFLLAVTASASKGTFNTLVDAISLVVTRKVSSQV
jgi:hypothetical protein